MNTVPGRTSPLYKQIVEWVLSNIRSRELHPGEKLPTELELAGRFGVSRGTVRTALNTLCKNRVLEAVQGSGYYVSDAQDILEETARSYAIDQMDRLVRELRRNGLTDNEIQYCFRLSMVGSDSGAPRARIAVIECNPDILPVYHRQFRQIPGIEIDYCLMETGTLFDDVVNRADLIVTTPTHFKQVAGLRPDLLDKIIRYNISISRDTLLAVSSLTGTERIGLACISPRYAQMVQEALSSFRLSAEGLRISSPNGLPELLEEINLLILPAGSRTYEEHLSEIDTFLRLGGRLLHFDYQIEKGSIAYIEEQVAAIADRGRGYSSLE